MTKPVTTAMDEGLFVERIDASSSNSKYLIWLWLPQLIYHMTANSRTTATTTSFLGSIVYNSYGTGCCYNLYGLLLLLRAVFFVLLLKSLHFIIFIIPSNPRSNFFWYLYLSYSYPQRRDRFRILVLLYDSVVESTSLAVVVCVVVDSFIIIITTTTTTQTERKCGTTNFLSADSIKTYPPRFII